MDLTEYILVIITSTHNKCILAPYVICASSISHILEFLAHLVGYKTVRLMFLWVHLVIWLKRK